MSKIDTALILAAGHGTRMRPLTDNKCKAMVQIAGRPLIKHCIDRLGAAGIRRAIVNIHAFADDLENYLKQLDCDLEIIISDEREELLETGGAVVKALALLGKNPVIICNIDAIWIEFENVLKALLAAWDAKKMDELFLLAHRDNALGIYSKGDFELLPDAKIKRAGKNGSDYYYAGIEIFKPDLARNYPLAKFSRNKIWDDTLRRGKAYGFVLPGFWMHVGDIKALKLAQIVLDQAGGGGGNG